MFDVNYETRDNLVHSVLAGFLEVAEVERYAAKVEPILERAAARARGYIMLIDVSGCAIQSQDVVVAFQQHVARVGQARRVAVVTGSAMIRLQARRVMSGSHVQMFEDQGAARAWLLEGAAKAAQLVANGRQ